MKSHSYYFEKINSELKKIDFGSDPANLYSPIDYVMNSGGKRIRPILTLMAAELFGGNYFDALKPAIGIEIFHNFTLLHDDMMDNAEVRRGIPVVHEKWNRNIALLSGDAMSVISYQFLAQSKNNLSQILDIFSRTALNICEGQQLDMDFEQREDVDEKEYLKMINLKTAVLLACSLKVGAIVANASKQESEKIFEFGRNLGLAFQLQDDFLDVYGDFKRFGKNLGNDIVSNKKTFLLINALKKASGKDKEELKYWLNIEKFDNTKKINAIKNLLNKLNIKEYTIDNMNMYFNRAFEIYDSIVIEKKQNKEALRNFAGSLRCRDF